LTFSLKTDPVIMRVFRHIPLNQRKEKMPR